MATLTPEPHDENPTIDPNRMIGSEEVNAPGSTGFHRSSQSEPSLSDLIDSNTSRRMTPASDVAAHLALSNPTTGSGSTPITPVSSLVDSDDAPTVITRFEGVQGNQVPLAPPPYVVGEIPSVAGRRLGHFELIEAIGSGGMAAVLKAHDLELGRTVALKILPPASAQDAENLTRFKQEARAAAKLDHENVARVYFCGEDQGLHFIAFEFVEGVTLRQLIDRRGLLSPGEAIRYMIQVAAGLSHAAEREVVHRDIKPSNIIITPDGRAKIVDMGLARHLGQPVNGGVTQSGVTLGTFDYISPEQAIDPRQADVRSDIYSLGCTFYHALTGRPPVPEGTAAMKLHAHQHVEPLDPRELNPAIPDDLAAVLAHMMAKDPKRRYPSPGELIGDLKSIGAHLDPASSVGAGISSVRSILPSRQIPTSLLRVRTSVVFAASAVLIAVTTVVYSGSGTSGSPISLPSTTTASTRPGSGAVSEGQTPVQTTQPRLQPGADGFIAVSNVADLAEVFARVNPPSTKIRLASGEYDVTTLSRPLSFDGANLELVGSTGRPTRLRLSTGLSLGNQRNPGELSIRARSISIKNMWFELATPFGLFDRLVGREEAGLVIDATSVDLKDCVFLPPETAREGRLKTVAINPHLGDVANVRIERCLFAPGGIGVRVPNRSAVTVEDSGFGSCIAALQVEDSGPKPDPEMEANDPGECTILLGRSSFVIDADSAAVQVGASVRSDVRVTAGYCVFSTGDGGTGPNGPGNRGAVVRTAGLPSEIQFKGVLDHANAYYQVDPVATATRSLTFEESRASGFVAEDAMHVELRRRPWDPPTGGLAKTFDGPEPWKALRLRIVAGQDPDSDLFVVGGKVKVVGAQFSPEPMLSAGKVYSGMSWPPANPRLLSLPATKVWVPGATETAALNPGEYVDLVKLLRDAHSGDTILIRHTGPLLVEQVVIEPPKPWSGADRADFNLTFKPEKDHKPILTPAVANQRDLSLFRIREGRVHFEGLQFRLKPGTDQDSIAAVSLVAGRGCSFKKCLFTLEEDERQIASVLSLTDPNIEMKIDAIGAKLPPRLSFEQCLIRGRGRAVWVPVSRPFDLEMRQNITALNGPVVGVAAGGIKDPGGRFDSNVKFSRMTCLLGGPLFELHGGRVGEMRASGLVPTNVTAETCLFAAVPGSGRPIVEVEGTDLDPRDPSRILRWEGGDTNRFANFDPMIPIVVVRPGDGNSSDWDWDKWISFAKEVGKPFGDIKFAKGPTSLKEMAGIVPSDLVILSEVFPDLKDAKPGDAGADPVDILKPMSDESQPEDR